MDKTSRKRVIVFGNPGTEKTPFVNTLIGGKDLCNEIVIDSSRYTIYDTPGLIADNQVINYTIISCEFVRISFAV